MATKRCTRCGKRKPLTKFCLNRSKKSGRQSWCTSCCVEYNRKWLAKNPGAKRQRNNHDYLLRRQWLDRYLEARVCTRCGQSDPAVLEFHHRNPAKKVAGIAKMVRRGYGLAALKREVRKCDVVCANCHRKLTKLQWDLTAGELRAKVSKRPGFPGTEVKGDQHMKKSAKKSTAKKPAPKKMKKGKC